MRFLCVDDDALNLQVLTDMLHVAGALAWSFTSAKTALDELGVRQYDMVLVDLGMPDMNGAEFIQNVRCRKDGRENIPIIVVTGESRKAELTECIEAGADSVVSKPVIMEALFESIGTVFANRSDDL